ncbi:hypothetical protein C0389_07600 [bacterium]|nr:hypothetical protein [bacterium]
MKLAELQKKIADVLGVSASQKELSFEIFVDKLSEILLEHITIKVPRIGYFQLKVASSKSENRPLIFSPLSEDFSRESRNLYLTIEVSPKIRNAPEADSNIFSIGVGKPLLPLSIDELPDTETSYAMLKKSIEERVKELLMESDQIPNFNIWDDYYKSPEEYEAADEAKSQLYNLSSDLTFKEEIIPDKIPESISDDFNLSSTESEQTPGLDYADMFLEVNKSTDETVDFNDPLIESKGELEQSSPEALFPPDEQEETIDIFDNKVEEENYSALHDLQLDEISSETITISDLLDDHASSYRDEQNIQNHQNETDESIVPFEDVMPRMLTEDKVEDVIKGMPEEDKVEDAIHVIPDQDKVEEAIYGQPAEEEVEIQEPGTLIDDKIEEDDKENIEITTEFMPDNKKSLFVELDELSKEVETLRESGLDNFEKIQNDDEGEKIEWNWGDELKEEFGLNISEDDKEKYGTMPGPTEEKEGDLKLVDDYLDEEMTTHDLFSKLEKTLEREFDFEEEPKRRFTIEDKRPTLDRNKLKKVVMEFSGPPAKYEFIEDRPSERERRMAITLVDDGEIKKTKRISDTDEEIKRESKNSYFRKMFLIISSVFVVLAAVVVFIVIYGNNSNQVSKESSPSAQTNKNIASDSGQTGILTPSNTTAKESTDALLYDEFTDFPRTATPPVPIKDATDKQILETIKNETAKLQSSQKVNEKPLTKQANMKQENKGLDKSVTTDTKVSNRIFSDGKSFFLQVSSWPNRMRAEEEVNRLRGLGFNGFIIEANLPQKGGIWYRVRVGPFKSVTETEEFMKKNKL